MGQERNRQAIEENKTALGIEFGSTRIKAVLVGEDNAPIAQEIMSGRTGWRTASGPTVLMMYGRVCRTAMQNWHRT